MRVRHLRAADADPAEFIAGANRAFGQWGDEATFAWAFRGGDILLLDDDRGRAVAGTGITYRTLQTGQPLAIITAAWTGEEARGMGAFRRLIDATHAVAGERNLITIAFGRMDNISRRRLQDAGAQIHATFYCRSIHASEEAPPLDVLEAEEAMFPTGFRFSAEEWRRQFLERPHATVDLLGRRGEWAAVVERTGDFDRVLAVSQDAALPLLAARAHAAGRRLFWFTREEPAFACEWTDGFLSTFPATDVTAWALQNGDRM